jgi:D-cysteine desulfhydrase
MITERNKVQKLIMRIERLKLDALALNMDIFMARDDLYPLFMGGNKARKMVHIISDIQKNQCNAVVTTGGIQSNHCRVVAIACAMHGWECKLVLHGSREQFFKEKGNALIMRAKNAQIEFVSSEEIGPSMKRAMEEFKIQGLNPYYLYGGGHNEAGVRAYVEGVRELKEALPADTSIDHIFLASGTGSTQAGILVGCKEIGWGHTRVHGISVARGKSRGMEAIRESLDFIHTNSSMLYNEIHFSDEYLFGGYGNSDPDLDDFIGRVADETGVILDSTYSGKAFYGMIETLKRGGIDGNTLFWHTGGILNLMA